MFGSMTDANTDVIQGTLDMLILKTLSLSDLCMGLGLRGGWSRSQVVCSR
jgi:hypothetical protein